MQESEFTEIQLLLKLLTLSSWAQGFDLQIFHKLKVRLPAMLGNVLAMFGNVCYNTSREAEQ